MLNATLSVIPYPVMFPAMAMKPLHWTPLALVLASCTALNSAEKTAPPLGPGSRVVMPSLSQPRIEAPPPAPVHVPAPAILPEQRSVARRSAQLELLAGVLVRALHGLATHEPRAPEVVAPPGPTEPGRRVADSPTTSQVPDVTPEVSNDEETRLIALAAEALAAKRWEALSEYTEQLRALPNRDKARALRTQGRYQDELNVLDLALATAPDRPELLEAAGTVRLTLAEQGRTELLEPARELFVRAGGTPTALLGQSRAARILGLHDEALASARRALVLLSVQREQRFALDPAAEFVFGQAGLEVHRQLRTTPGPAAAALFVEIQDALRARIAERPTDARSHALLCEVYLDLGMVTQAEAAAARGLNSSPGDAPLTELLARAALTIGVDELIEVFATMRKQYPNQALAHWYPAREYFKCSVAGFTAPGFTGTVLEQLGKAERGFKNARRCDARIEKSCMEYESLTRAQVGWRALESGDLAAARRAFLSMNEIAPGLIAIDSASVDAQWTAGVGNGIAGLAQIAERYRELKNSTAAAAIYADLAREAPGDARWARAAEELADILSEEAGWFEEASRGEVLDPQRLERLRRLARTRPSEDGTPSERARFGRTAESRRASAAESYAVSWRSYLRAIEAAPQDVRLAAEAARVAIRHTGADLERAESLLRNAVESANAQRQLGDLKPAELDQLLVAWAFAEQVLGEFELDTRRNPAAAETHFRAALDISPYPLPHVSEILLKRAIEASTQDSGVPDREPPPDAPITKDRP